MEGHEPFSEDVYFPGHLLLRGQAGSVGEAGQLEDVVEADDAVGVDVLGGVVVQLGPDPSRPEYFEAAHGLGLQMVAGAVLPDRPLPVVGLPESVAGGGRHEGLDPIQVAEVGGVIGLADWAVHGVVAGEEALLAVVGGREVAVVPAGDSTAAAHVALVEGAGRAVVTVVGPDYHPVHPAGTGLNCQIYCPIGQYKYAPDF